MTDVPPPGVQNERTALAWQRTALSLIVATIALARLTFDELGFVAVLVLALALPLATWVFLESGTRYRQRSGRAAAPAARGGRVAAALAGVLVLLALTELAAIAAGG